MHNFKVGDEVKRKDGDKFGLGCVKQFTTVTIGTIDRNKIWFKETSTWLHFSNIELVKEKPFMKEDLKAGLHAVKTRDGKVWLVTAHGFSYIDGHNTLDVVNCNMMCSRYSSYDIMEVFELKNSWGLDKILADRNLKSIWKREKPKSNQQLEFEELQEKIKELQKQAAKLGATLC